jgi:nucleoside-diphosphate-sugar epimerase
VTILITGSAGHLGEAPMRALRSQARNARGIDVTKTIRNIASFSLSLGDCYDACHDDCYDKRRDKRGKASARLGVAFLARVRPFPAKRALIRTGKVALSVT